MPASESPDDYQPITWIGGHPVRGAGVLVLFYVATMVSTTLAMSLNLDAVLQAMKFSSEAVLGRGAVWQMLTYAAVNIPGWGFVFDMAVLWWFGGELEKFFGRRAFLKFYFLLLLLTPILFTLLGFWRPFTLFGAPGSLAVFIAFATLYPDVPLLFGVLLAKYIAAILIAIYSLQFLAMHDWPEMLSLWASALFAYGFVRFEQGRFALPARLRRGLSFWQKKPRFNVVHQDTAPLRTLARSRPRPRAEKKASEDVVQSIDALLEKISHHGIGSLTAKERAALERASEVLNKKDGRRP
jgi:membrane associated rhomboid family serine protease